MKENSLGHRNLSIATIRALCIDMINKANSGHPGMALDIAPAMYALFHDHLVADPNHPEWFNRDRFVLSSGHVSSLLYAMLHLCGYPCSVDDLKSFRTLDSITAGHPEVGFIPGIDATSGPLGQGIAQAVGMAMAEKAISHIYEDGASIMNHFTYCLCGDGCLEEGLSQEAISLAGHYQLNKLILIYDENGSTLDGPTSDSLTENTAMRFASANWDVIDVADGNDSEAVSRAIAKAKLSKEKPTVIIVHTTIGFGSQKAGSHKTHGEPLGIEDGEYAKKQFGYELPPFEIDPSVYEDFKASFVARGSAAYNEYQQDLADFKANSPESYEHFINSMTLNLDSYHVEMPEFGAKEASRASSGKVLAAMAKAIPFTMGGSADVAGSTKTNIAGMPIFGPEHPEGRDVHWGIREFGMASAANGMALHRGLIPYVSCFFVFSDYMKSAIRMSALEHLQVIYLFTHDSIAVGQDGPTHQPIEHLAALRAMPNLDTIRPADAKETYGAYLCALENKHRPTALILSRQNLPTLESSSVEGVQKGGYIIHHPTQEANLSIIATGSEVALGIEAAKLLEEQGIYAEVVSLPSSRRFLEQDKAYQDSILHLPYDRRVSLEMASTFGWKEFAKINIGIDCFGASGEDVAVLAKFGFTNEAVAKRILDEIESQAH